MRRSRPLVIAVLGVGQIFGWGSSYYLPAVLAKPIAEDTGWSLPWVVAGLTIGSLAAGLISARVGHGIQARGGRPVMMLGTALLASGLMALGLSQNLTLHLLAWIVIGTGMGCSLYDAAFATLGRLYGQDARRAITHLTLFGGFASTVCWPLSALCLEWLGLGWRATCFAYAAVHLGLVLPLYALVLPGRAEPPKFDASIARTGVGPEIPGATPKRQWMLFGLMATAFSLGWGISSVLSVHLLTILQARGLELAGAVALGALVGPSQVGGRVLEMIFGKHYRPIHTLLISVVLVASGVGLLAANVPMLAFALVAYGAGIGIASIARGTLPLVVFGHERYAVWVGRLAGPALVAGAVSPTLAAGLLDLGGPAVTLCVLEALALVNIGVALLLWSFVRSPNASGTEG
ncbi:MAG TPA: MFS transporter [Beijerinckiaceae bacterium]|nr:MFS transporter [Beijerinckiaceae bacterium]